MGLLIKGMEMLSTGLYLVSVDNTGGKDKTVVTIEHMLGNRDVRQIIGSFELVSIPPHGRLIDADVLIDKINNGYYCEDLCQFVYAVGEQEIKDEPTVIEAEGEK